MVAFGKPSRPTKAARSAVEAEAASALLDVVDHLKSIKGTGQEWGGEGNVNVNERRAALSVLMSRLPPAELQAVLPKKGGKVLETIRDDITWLGAAERQPLTLGKLPDLTWAKNGSSNAKVLKHLAQRRAAAAQTAAELITATPGSAYDASNDSMLAHLCLKSSDLRAQILADTLLQFRATRRTTSLIDAIEDADNATLIEQKSQGRIASSGPLATMEQRLAAKLAPTGKSAGARREYALTRLAVANHPHGTTNGIFTARNAAAVLVKYLGDAFRKKTVGDAADGLGVSPYYAIHSNYTANTPRVVDSYIRDHVFTGGAREDRLAISSTCVETLRETTLAAARARLARLAATTGHTIAGVDGASSLDALKGKVLEHVAAHTKLSKLKKLDSADRTTALGKLIELHAAVCDERPSDRTLERGLFYAGAATSDVAALICAMRSGGQADQLEALAVARKSLSSAFRKAKSGFDRQMLWRLDRQVERLSAQTLGMTVSRVQSSAGDETLGEAMLAVRSALVGTLASGLDAIRGRAKTAPVADLQKLAKRVDAMLAKPSAKLDDIRALMTEVYQSASEVAESAREYFRRREAAIHFSDVDVSLDPEFGDNLIKETPLHYLLALSQAGMTWGLESKITANEISAVNGMRVLNSVGPTVYKRVLVAKDLKQLRKLQPTPDDFCIVHQLDEKKMVAVGGLLADTADAPGGYSHLSVFAKGHGISAIALPNLKSAYGAFLKNVSEGGGLYVDDRNGTFRMLPMKTALAEGLVKAGDVDRMRPGFNRHIEYVRTDGDIEKVIASNDVHLSDARETRSVALYVPDLTDTQGLGTVQSFEALGAMAIGPSRHLAGEKGAVLARLSTSKALKALGVDVPGGSVIPPFKIAELLKAASVGEGSAWDAWMSVWSEDPGVGEITDDNFAQSAFYTDPGYRQATCQKLRKAVRSGLKKLLLSGKKPTAAGKKLLDELVDPGGLDPKQKWIARSSFTGEDRPNKSGAGQYESFANLKTSADRLDGIIGVITSAWEDTPVDNNVKFGIDLRHVWPSVVVQTCLAPSVSGVAVSRGPSGELGEVSYQAVKGFGGGVEGGKPEEGVIGAKKSERIRPYGSSSTSLLTPAQQTQLRKAILAIEAQFHASIEPGQAYAVDVEWALENGKLNIVQARVIVGA